MTKPRAAKPRTAKLPVYIEVGAKRVFAGAIAWPGWSRNAPNDEGALEALVAYGPRYRAALGRAARDLTLPESVAALDVRERLEGNATTDFGAPGIPPSADARPVTRRELDRLLGTLEASWAAFDRAARGAKGAELAKGPRGGGRDLDAIVRHVFEAQAGYLRALGTRSEVEAGPPARQRSADRALRREIVAALSAAPLSGPAPSGPRGGRRWTVRYFIRRSAWHALDHAWEVEDRIVQASAI